MDNQYHKVSKNGSIVTDPFCIWFASIDSEMLCRVDLENLFDIGFRNAIRQKHLNHPAVPDYVSRIMDLAEIGAVDEVVCADFLNHLGGVD